MRLKSVAAVLALSLLAGGAMADGAPDPTQRAAPNERGAGPIERGLARIDYAIARLQAKLSGRPSSDSGEGCEEMMGGGVMGGGSPNKQWRGPAER